MDTIFSLKNHFLIAMPNLENPSFFRTVTYIFEHTPSGAMGIIINQASNILFKELIKQVDPSAVNYPDSALIPIYIGGPVQCERGFVVHRPQGLWQTSEILSTELAITVSQDILQAIASKKSYAPKDYFIALGYARWEAGQLEAEIKTNAWLASPASAELIFNTPIQKRWRSAAALTGVDVERIHTIVGHA